MTVLSDAEIIQQVAAIDTQIQALADSASTMLEQFYYKQAAYYTSEAAIIHQENKRWSDLSDSYRYWFNLTQAADKVRLLDRKLARRIVTLANKINPPHRKGDDEYQSPYPHLN